MPSLCLLCLPARSLTQMRSWHWFHSSCLRGHLEDIPEQILRSCSKPVASFNSCGMSSWRSSKDTSHNFKTSSIQRTLTPVCFLTIRARSSWEIEVFYFCFSYWEFSSYLLLSKSFSSSGPAFGGTHCEYPSSCNTLNCYLCSEVKNRPLDAGKLPSFQTWLLLWPWLLQAYINPC